MRTSKIVALVATAALLVVGTAFASFAAGKTGWDNSEGVWKYYKNGEIVTNDWAKSGSDYYYLDENGEMATEKLVDGDNLYYVDAEGKMVKGNWVKLANEDDDPSSEFVYYYFQKTGKAYKATSGAPAFKTIDGKKYAFDSDGRMLWGWIHKDAASLQDTATDSESTAWTTCDYYLGDANDGAQATGWRKIAVYDTNPDLEGSNDQEYYFYFGTNGKKYADATKTIDGKKYAFAGDGHMVSSLVPTSPSIASGSKGASTNSAAYYMYFSTAEDGARYAKKWFRVAPTKVMDKTANADEEAHWFYAKSNATLAKSEMITWNGKQYAFAENGEMLSGLYAVSFKTDKSMAETPYLIDDATKLDTYTKLGKVNDNKKSLYYFGDEETDGAMKTGVTKVEIDGDTYTFKFKTSGTLKGHCVNGYDGGCYYLNGLKLAADADQKYQLIKLTGDYSTTDKIAFEGEFFNVSSIQSDKWDTTNKTVKCGTHTAVFSSTGTIKKSGTCTDADGYKIKVSDYVVKEITNADKVTFTAVADN